MITIGENAGLGQYQPDLPYAAPQPGGGPTESDNLYYWYKQYGYPDMRNQPASLLTKYPGRGLPSSPGETDEWAPLPAQGSSYAGKGVTMPDVATHGLGEAYFPGEENVDMFGLSQVASPMSPPGSYYPGEENVPMFGLGQPSSKKRNLQITALRIGAVAGMAVDAAFLWYFLRANKLEKKRSLRILGYIGMFSAGLGMLGAGALLAAPEKFIDDVEATGLATSIGTSAGTINQGNPVVGLVSQGFFKLNEGKV
jgi:hypothetical protein